MISKRHAEGVQHLLGMLAPAHPDRYQLADSRAEEVVVELANLSAATLGSGLDGDQVREEWQHQPGEIVLWLTAHETPEGRLAFDGADLAEDDARERVENLARTHCETGTEFGWGPVHPDDPHGPQALFADPPEREEYPTGHQVHRVTTRLA
ncbi:hypothetical protein ACFXJ8_26150 [Nonomuraea sp. NPDC059194]|uniref:hypothetical protein n=1 Tax=Nonomuraea sp. NPDC059194 TaxID=3346764 RepID=UPI0036B27FD8